MIDETRKGSSHCSWGPNVAQIQTIFAKEMGEYEYLTALSNSVIYVSMTTYDTWIISIGNIAWFVVIFGINTTSDISKLLYVISRAAIRWVKFEAILKYHERYLQYAKYHLQIVLSFVYTATRERFVVFTCRYHCSKPIKLQKFLT